MFIGHKNSVKHIEGVRSLFALRDTHCTAGAQGLRAVRPTTSYRHLQPKIVLEWHKQTVPQNKRVHRVAYLHLGRRSDLHLNINSV